MFNNQRSRFIRIVNATKDTTLSSNCKLADTFTSRLVGLSANVYIPNGSGLLISPCNSIHMFFMKFSIDAIFIDKDNTVVHLIKGLKPWRVSKVILKSRCVLELPEGTVDSSKTFIGDRLKFDFG